jgi:hypothetical protein
MEGSEKKSSRGASMTRCIVEGLAVYALSSAPVLFAATFGVRFTDPCTEHPYARHESWLDGVSAWDGHWYKSIVDHGYSYDPRVNSNVAFFPAYPVAAKALQWALNLDTTVALLIVSNLCLAGAFVTFRAYLGAAGATTWCSLFAMGLFPGMLYARMCYTEAMFLWLVLLAVLGIRDRWNPALVAGIIGLATATRLVGIALVLPLVIGECRRSSDAGSLFARLMVLVPLSLWGIVSFSLYLLLAFGEPFAFARAQLLWAERTMPTSFTVIIALLSFEPLWAPYASNSPCYWQADPPRNWGPWFNMMFMNPILFCSIAGLVGFGAYKRWLKFPEVVVAAGLLAIPYAKGYLMCFVSSGRYAAMAFPAYIVAGRLCASLPLPVGIGLAVVNAAITTVYAALFASWYWFY